MLEWSIGCQPTAHRIDGAVHIFVAVRTLLLESQIFLPSHEERLLRRVLRLSLANMVGSAARFLQRIVEPIRNAFELRCREITQGLLEFRHCVHVGQSIFDLQASLRHQQAVWKMTFLSETFEKFNVTGAVPVIRGIRPLKEAGATNANGDGG